MRFTVALFNELRSETTQRFEKVVAVLPVPLTDDVTVGEFVDSGASAGLEPTLHGFKFMEVNLGGPTISLFATVFVHDRPNRSILERTNL